MVPKMHFTVILLPLLRQLWEVESSHNHRISRTNRKSMFDGSIVSAVQRQLEVQSATEFCSNLAAIEEFVTRSLEFFFDSVESFTFLTEENKDICSCLLDNEYLHLSCGSMYSFEGIFVPVSNNDYIQLKLGADGVYTPESVGWCEYPDGNDFGPRYCEDYTLNSEDPTIFDACFVNDETCPDGTISCEVCEGGRTVAFDSCYIGSVTCDSNYTGAYMYEYQAENAIKVTPDELIDCVDDAPTTDIFCADLSEIESTITQAFRDYVPQLELTPYECGCGIENSTFAMRCHSIYFDSSNNSTYQSDEVMLFEEQNGYLIPSTMQWCDVNVVDPADFYCESFEFAFLQTELSHCDIGGCGSGFCELCSNGLTVAHACYENATCSENIPGAFLFTYKDVKLAIEKCPPPTMAPVTDIITAAPADASSPTMAPAASNPTMAPAGGSPDGSPEIESSASTMKCLMLVSASVATMIAQTFF